MVKAHDAMTVLYAFQGNTGLELYKHFERGVASFFRYCHTNQKRGVYVLIFDGDSVDPHKLATQEKRRKLMDPCVQTECSDEMVPQPFLSGCKTSTVRKAIIRYIFETFVKRMSLTESDRLILQGPESVWCSRVGSEWTKEEAIEIPLAYQEGDCAAFFWLNRLAQEEGPARLLATSLDSDLLVIGLLHEERYAQHFYLELKETGHGDSSIFDMAECVKDLERRRVNVRNFCFCLILQGTDHVQKQFFRKFGSHHVAAHLFDCLPGVPSFWSSDNEFDRNRFLAFYKTCINTLSKKLGRKTPEAATRVDADMLENAIWNTDYWRGQ